jgi:hypothetical protein
MKKSLSLQFENGKTEKRDLNGGTVYDKLRELSGVRARVRA